MFSVQDSDSSIRQTDSDAAGARLSAVQKHYLVDPFIQHLVPRAHLQQPRPPLINVGTHVRALAIDHLVHQWLVLSSGETTPQCQIVSLGAGSDTRFWRIATGPLSEHLRTYIEIDFPEVTTKKAMAIQKNKVLRAALGDPSDISIANGGTALHSSRYHLVPADLRDPPEQSMASLTSPSPAEPLLSPHLPTLLLFECVLVYMEPASSNALIDWFVRYFAQPTSSPLGTILGGIVYEMFGLQDSFGQVMLNHMRSRNVTLPGAEPYPTITSLPNRFLRHGFQVSEALTLRDIRRSVLDPEERERASKLEMLDEIEELELVLNHYAITWGLRYFSSNAPAERWISWALKSLPETQNSEDGD